MSIKHIVSTIVLLLIITSGSLLEAQDDKSKREIVQQEKESWAQSAVIQDRLEMAGENRSALELAIQKVDRKQSEGLKFLLLNMPEHDLKNLSSGFLLTNIELAYRARAKAAWEIPDDLFFNDVLPYANIDEPRDPWRKELYELCKPIVKGCKTPGEAAQKLNAMIFKEISVKYSTARKRANQSPKESIDQGLASCTGLSIILVDACRSVGVPARVVGIPSWKNKKGNHTWVEVWDEDWNFTGAAEFNPKGLNRAWFQRDAALADETSKRHSIYAVSFKNTKTDFPMVWSPEKRVYAENVTARYAKPAETKTAAAKELINVMIRIWNKDKTHRQIADVKIVLDSDADDSEGRTELKGKTKGGTADMNDMLMFQLMPESDYKMMVHRKGDLEKDQSAVKAIFELKTGSKTNQLAEFILVPDEEHPNEEDDRQEAELRSGVSQLPTVPYESLKSAADKFFSNAAGLPDAIKENPDAVRKLAWERYLKSRLVSRQQSDFDKSQVTFEEHLSPYTIKEVGKRPANGWPLFIAMHGGGGAPQRVNDSQWKHMQIYYKDQKQLQGYKYLALRAPNNTWNGFYDDYVYPLIENLVRQHIALGDVDPNKIFIMGYSHGGYGAFAIGPKIPYRFAAVHSSAAAPSDGQTSAKTLRNTRFTFMVGEKDTAHGRRKRCEKFAAQIEELQDENEGAYPVEFMYKEGFGHGGLPDRDMIGQMYEHSRDPAPKHVTWEMTDSVVKRFFWLRAEQPKRGQLIDARIEGNTIEVKTENCDSFSILLDRRLIDPTKPIELKLGERVSTVEYKPSFETVCETIAETGDINLAFDFEIKVNLEK